MSTKDDRYYTAVALAQLILEEPPAEDERLLSEAVQVLRGEVEAGRRNQRDFPRVSAEVFEQLAHPKPRLYAVTDEQFSVRVPGRSS